MDLILKETGLADRLLHKMAVGQAGTVGRQITVNANNPATRQIIFGVNLNF